MIEPARLADFEKRLPELRFLVIGDLMLDRYVWGDVTRISPEAPVPVLDVNRAEVRPGGAANVALNIAAMGANVSICGVTGNDDEGQLLMKRLVAKGFDTRLVIQDAGRPTTTKTRHIAQNQQILRVDREVREPLSETLSKSLLTGILGKLPKCDAVIFEDYDKGLLGKEMIETVIHWANVQDIPTFVDPKYRNFLHYHDVSLFKPNLKELNDALALRLKKDDREGIIKAVARLRKKMPHKNTLITLSEHGLLAIGEDLKAHHFPAHFRKITDVSGAGDTVVAVVALALTAGLPLHEAAHIANLAGGLVCEEVGVAPLDKARLLAEFAQ